MIDRAAFNQGENAQYDPHIEQTDVMDTLVARGPHAVCAARMTAFGEYVDDDSASTLKARDYKDATDLIVYPDLMEIRRLTPRECERLQGFPDDHTRIPWRGKTPEGCPDGPRYKCCGNSMAVPVIRWIGRRIEEAR